MDSEAKKACSTQAETNQRRLYVLLHNYTCTLHHVHISALLAQVVLPTYIIAPVKIHVENWKRFYCVLMWLSFSTLLLKAAKKGEETSKFKKIEILKGI